MKDLEIHMNAPEGASPAELDAYIDQACDGDEQLKERVKALFDAEANEELDFLQKPAHQEALTEEEISAPEGNDESAGRIIGRYKLLEKLGEGGFGSVWAAEQLEPVKRRVALKIIKLGMDTKQVVARFEAERQALALMDHPNIAKVLDAGTTEKGRPYFVMELVKGIPITKYVEQESPDFKKKLNLFIQVCRAIQHAHQKGIIHRDIKPSNVMVTLHDGEPVPKVIDFGIAKATQGDLTDKTIYTQYSQFIGTPAYMSPEQAEMSGLDVDTRSDIYSLGVLLYEILTGSTPFDTKELMASGIDEMRKIIREQDPVKPSTRLNQTLEAASGGTKRKLPHPQPLHSDLDWIVLKCLEKDRSRRYETANGLAKDIERHLDHEAVLACPPSTTYWLKKTWRRNKLAVSAGMAIAASLVLGLSASFWFARVAINEKIQADQARIGAETSEREKEIQREAAEKAKQQATENAAIAIELERSMRLRAYAADMNLAQRALELDDLGKAQKLLDRYRPGSEERDLRGWEWRYLWGQTRDGARDVISESSSKIFDLAVSNDGQWLAVSRQNRSGIHLSLRNMWSGKEETISSSENHFYQRVAFSSDGTFLAYYFEQPEDNQVAEIRLINVPLREVVKRIKIPENPGTCVGLQFTEDNESLLFLISSDRGRLWSYDLLKQGTQKPRLLTEVLPNTHDVYSSILAISEEGQFALVRLDDGEIRALDIATGNTLWSHRLNDVKIHALAISPDGKQIAIGSLKNEPEVIVLETESRKEIIRFKGHRAWIGRVRFLKDGELLASSSADQTIRLWDLESLKPIGVLRGHSREIWSLASFPDHSLVSGSKNGEIKVWSLPTAENNMRTTRILKSTGEMQSYAFSPDSASIFIHQNQSIFRYHGESFQEREEILKFKEQQNGLFQPAGWLFAHGVEGKSIEVVDLRNGRQRGKIPVPSKSSVHLIDFNQEGTGLWALDKENGSIQEWIFGENEANRTIKFQAPPVQSYYGMNVSIGSDNWIFGFDQNNRAWARDGKKERPSLHIFNIKNLNIPLGKGVSSPGLNFFAMGQEPGVVNVWDLTALKTGENPSLKFSLGGAIMSYHGVRFSNDERRLVAGSGLSQFLTLWETESFESVLTLPGRGWSVRKITFSPDGNTLAAWSREGLHIWKAPSWEEIQSAENATNAHPSIALHRE